MYGKGRCPWQKCPPAETRTRAFHAYFCFMCKGTNTETEIEKFKVWNGSFPNFEFESPNSVSVGDFRSRISKIVTMGSVLSL